MELVALKDMSIWGQYCHHPRLVELHDMCDELEKHGVFAKSDDIGITVEYLKDDQSPQKCTSNMI
jgi:hypothetical protein